MNHKEMERWYRLKSIKRAAQFLALIAIVVLASGYTASRYFRDKTQEFSGPVTTEDGIRIDNFVYSSPGAHPFELEAASARVSNSLDKVTLGKTTVTYRRGSAKEIVLTAESGELDKEARSVRAKGNVVVRMKGFVIRADEIEYSDKERIIAARSRVSLDGGDIRVTGKGLKLFVDRQEVRIERNVKTRLLNVKWVEPGQRLPM